MNDSAVADETPEARTGKMVRGANVASAVFEKVGSLIIVIMVLLVTTEVIGRNFFNLSTLIADDVLGLLLGCMTFLGFAESFRSKSHIRVDFLTHHFSEKGNRLANVAASFLAMIYALVLFVYTLKLAVNSFQLSATTQTSVPLPLWPFQFIVPLGILVFILVLVCYGFAEMKALRNSR